MNDNNIIYIGPPGSGKTYTALQEAKKCREYKLISFHPGYSYQDFIKGINVRTENDRMLYQSSDKIFIEFCKKAADDPSSEYALILDDIQRADFSGIFGELMYAVEYRSQTITISEGSTCVSVPENLKIYATLSTAGGKAHMDYAFLRRFRVNYMFSSADVFDKALSSCDTVVSFYKDISECVKKIINKTYISEIDNIIGFDDIFSSYYSNRDNTVEDAKEKLQKRREELKKDPNTDLHKYLEELIDLLENMVDRKYSKTQIKEAYKIKNEQIPAAILNSKLNGHNRITEILTGMPCDNEKRIIFLNDLIGKLKNGSIDFDALDNEILLFEHRKKDIVMVNKMYREINDFVIDHKCECVDDEKIKLYTIGHTYFILPDAYSAVMIVRERIVNQLIPLLDQYKKDGIIDFTNGDKETLKRKYIRTYTTDYNEVDRDMQIEWCSQKGNFLGQSIKQSEAFILKSDDSHVIKDDNGNEITGSFNNAYEFTLLFLDRYKKYAASQKRLTEYYYFGEYSYANKYSYPELINTMIFFLLDTKLIDNTSFYNAIMKNIRFECYISKEKKDDENTEEYNRRRKNTVLSLYNHENEGYYHKKTVRNNNDYSYFSINGRNDLKEYVLSSGSYPFTEFNTALDYTLSNGSQRYPDIVRIIQTFYNYYAETYKEYYSQTIEDNSDYDDFRSVFTSYISSYKKSASMIPAKFINDLSQFCTDLHNALKNPNVKGIYKIMDTNYYDIMNSLNIRQMILQGPPGTSKTYGAKKFIAERISELENIDIKNVDPESFRLKYNESDHGKKVLWDIVQFHPSYSYEDFVRGIEVGTEDGAIRYKTVNKILGKIADAAVSDPENEYYLVIDEINRANMATVFGELIYALEYRGQAVSTPYSVKKSAVVTIPDNLYIIGTMNTADKSIGGMDYAIRRRFLFFPVLPDEKIVEKNAEEYFGSIDKNDPPLNVRLFAEAAKIFDNYLESDYHKDDVQIGHTYFLTKADPADNSDTEVKKEKLEKLMFNRLKYQILPILREYYKDGILRADIKAPDMRKGLSYDNIYYYAVHYDEFTEELYQSYVSTAADNNQ